MDYKVHKLGEQSEKNLEMSNDLQIEEQNSPEDSIITHVQNADFSEEMKNIENGSEKVTLKFLSLLLLLMNTEFSGWVVI